jgi:peroxiredoxin
MRIKVGQAAPDFTLTSHRGDAVSLSDFQGRKNVVIAFFPLAWAPV